MLAAVLLTVMSFHWLFSGTAIGFIASALLVLSVRLPRTKAVDRRDGIYAKTTRGVRIYLKTPRLRGLLAVTLAAAAASAMVIVNTVVIVRDVLQLSQTDVALALAAYGAGSMLAALTLPRILDQVGDRPIMLGASAALTALLAALAAIRLAVPDERLWAFLLGGWFLLGFAYSMAVTPTGRLLRRSANPEDRPTLFAAQFALSHACWLIAYPLAGWLGAGAGQAAAFAGMAAIAACGTVLGGSIWPRHDPEEVPHGHEDLAPDHPHLRDAHRPNAPGHSFVIDDLHAQWPRVP